MATIRKRKRGGKVSKEWWIIYTDANGKRRWKKGYSDKMLTQQLAVKLEQAARRVKDGLEQESGAWRGRKYSEAVEAFLLEMSMLGHGVEHRYEVRRHLDTVAAACGWTLLGEISAEGLRAFLKRLQDEEKSPRTLNGYRNSLNQFCNWCVGQKPPWLPTNPVNHVKQARSPGKKKHKPRRAYTLDEFKKLLEAAPARRLIYLVAGMSGLRRKELRLLERQDFSPAGKNPTWHLRPEITKAKRFEKVPMTPEVAKALLPVWEKLKAGERVFPRWPRHQTFDKDLKRAGIVKVDGTGRCADFHSLRYFFCTEMGKRLTIQKVRVLMRHANIKQTCDVYMDLGLTDVGEEVWSAPSILGEKASEDAGDGKSQEGK